jgi:hypothetical protein
MSRCRISLPVFHLFIAAGWLHLLCATLTFAEGRLNSGHEATGSVLELLKEEVLDTVSLDRPVHFIAPNVTDAVVRPETYQVLSEGLHRIKLVSMKSKRVLIVEALSTTHTEDITEPIACTSRTTKSFHTSCCSCQTAKVWRQLAATTPPEPVAFARYRSRRSRFRGR